MFGFLGGGGAGCVCRYTVEINAQESARVHERFAEADNDIPNTALHILFRV